MGNIGGADHDDPSATLQPIHQGQELGDNALLNFSQDLLPLGSNGIELVNKDNARGATLSALEDIPQLGLTFTIELVDNLRAANGEKVGLGLVGHGPDKKGFPGPRRTVK